MKRRKQTELSHPNFVAVRLSDTEITILDQACASSGTTRSEYLRKLLTEKKIYNNVEIVADIKLLRELVGQYGKRFILCLHRSERDFAAGDRHFPGTEEIPYQMPQPDKLPKIHEIQSAGLHSVREEEYLTEDEETEEKNE